ncbi:MAG: amidohydrolase family protein [Planctomycetaceae bacterium]|jgi:cytosine/adenosine deaminase-related metal-dependent hydrolase|nr:amidohydrolase family protein [Planctomycetaceae bacterium]
MPGCCSFKAQRIYPMTGAVLENHWLNIADGLVESLSLKASFEQQTELPPQSILLPGLFNAHTHLELSQLSAPLDVPSRKMSDWIDALLAFRRSPEYNAEAAIQSALQKMTGTAVAADITPPQCFASVPPPTASDTTRLAFGELIAWREEQVPKITPSSRQYGVSPHAPQTVCPALRDYAAALNVPAAMHLAETLEELQLLRSGTGPLLDMMRRADADYNPAKTLLGKRPWDYLQLLSQFPKAFIIHGNYLDDEELRFLAKHRETMSVVYCPRSHYYFRHTAYPLRKMLDFGVRVLLGTDSAASAPDYNLANEIRFAAEQHPDVSIDEIYRSATSAAAEAFDLPQYGTLAAGQRAVFACLTQAKE